MPELENWILEWMGDGGGGWWRGGSVHLPCIGAELDWTDLVVVHVLVSVGLALVWTDQEFDVVGFKHLFGDIGTPVSSPTSERVGLTPILVPWITPKHI